MASRLAVVALACVVGAALARPQANQGQQPGQNGQGATGGRHGHDGHHGPLGAVYDKLTDAQKQQLQAIFQDKTQSKAAIKEKLTAFEQGLSPELQVAILYLVIACLR